jgi:hypothetical protein
VAEQTPPETLAITLIEHAYDTQPKPQEYLIRVVAELFAAEPGVLAHISGKWFTDLAEELGRCGQEDAMRAVLQVENQWRNERG